MLRGKMKGGSMGFPKTLQLVKPEKDNNVKFKKHEGSSQRVSGICQDSITSKRNPTQKSQCNGGE